MINIRKLNPFFEITDTWGIIEEYLTDGDKFFLSKRKCETKWYYLTIKEALEEGNTYFVDLYLNAMTANYVPILVEELEFLVLSGTDNKNLTIEKNNISWLYTKKISIRIKPFYEIVIEGKNVYEYSSSYAWFHCIFIINNKTDVNEKDEKRKILKNIIFPYTERIDYENAINSAISYNRYDIAKKLLIQSPNINLQERHNLFCENLLLEMRKEDVEIVQMTLNGHISNKSAIYNIVVNDFVEVFDYIFRNDPKIEHKEYQDYLLMGLIHNSGKIIKFLLENGMYIDIQEINDKCIFEEVVKNGCYATVELLLKYKCHIHAKVMENAIIYNRPSILRLLYQHGGIVKDYIILTAIKYDYSKVVKILLENKAPINKYAIIEAYKKKQQEIVKLLILHNAPIPKKLEKLLDLFIRSRTVIN